MSELENAIGYTFLNKTLLVEALTHRSYSKNNNERLEFLGDAVLNLIIGRILFDRYSSLAEGELTRIRSVLVNQDGLASIAKDLQMGRHLKLGAGEIKTDGANRPSILSDAVEAVLGAVYLDDGMEAAERVVLHLYGDYLEAINPSELNKDAKTKLQELLQARQVALPKYTIKEIKGQAHDQLFVVECAIDIFGIKTEGQGKSRRAAEQDAAMATLAKIK